MSDCEHNVFEKDLEGAGGGACGEGWKGGSAVAMVSVAMMEEGIISPPKLGAIGKMEAILRKLNFSGYGFYSSHFKLC